MIEKKDQEEMGQVALPFNENQFKDFLVSLLGKPQTITKNFNGSFEFTKDDIISLHQLLDNRILQQNDARLIQFRATVSYNDSSSVTLSGFDHLVNYNETLPIVSTSIHLTWQYLIKFRDKKNYEMQEVTISLVGNSQDSISYDEDFGGYYPGHNRIFIRIKHTARTWGADIENLIIKHLKTYVNKDPKILNFFRFNPERIEYLLFSLLFIINLCFAFIWQTNLNSSDISYLLSNYFQIATSFIVTLIIYKITAVFLDSFEVFNRPSFILLTKESEKNKTKSIRKY
ncbi:hypothetical protein JM79_2192 [Gramella sp. Hel_I_59]|uniref:hypothetical protein n=1 Tax=Gramella sp. Hel_I_59 TaxID=1249978 RepID=UPI001153F57B|nr:hypothetical protein [Gramella sp. Hel_I_59]TQI71265.1 hypothetical protein JM79_2192 [Gramella sp. Hel_I_59]